MLNFIMDEHLNIHKYPKWNEVRQNVENHKPVYIDVISPKEEDINSLRSIFSFHSTNLEDCTFFSEAPKIDEHKNYIFTVVHSVAFNSKDKVLEGLEVHIFLSKNYIVLVHERELDIMHEILERIVNENDSMELKCDYAYYIILDSIVDGYFPILNNWSNEIDEVEEDIYDTKSKEDVVNRIISIRKGLLTLKRVIVPQREILYRILHSSVNFISEDTRLYLKDVFDHVSKSCEYIEDHRDLLSNLMDAHFSKTSAELNEVMRKLTILSTIFMPLTFIVGVYGMNFRHMPELDWRYGYFVILSIMLFATIGLIIYFKRKKWF